MGLLIDLLTRLLMATALMSHESKIDAKEFGHALLAEVDSTGGQSDAKLRQVSVWRSTTLK